MGAATVPSWSVTTEPSEERHRGTRAGYTARQRARRVHPTGVSRTRPPKLFFFVSVERIRRPIEAAAVILLGGAVA
jgi:hypothetical protein